MSTNVNNSSNTNGSANFVNPHFDLIRLWIQENIGKFVVILLAITYLATGFFIGLALQKGLTVFGPYVSWIAGMSVAVIGQMIRGSLVYFSQANPYRLGGNAHIVGASAALLLTGYACYEVIHLLSAIEVSPAFQTSIVGLIIGGFFVEVFFLNELTKINQATLVNDPELYQQALDNEMKLSEIKIKSMEAKVMLVQARRSRLRQALATKPSTSPTPQQAQPEQSPTPQQAQQAQPEQPKNRRFSNAVLNAIGASYQLTDEQMANIRKMIDEARDDDHIIETIKMFSERNRQAKQNGGGVPLDLSRLAKEAAQPEFWESSQNGNGQH